MKPLSLFLTVVVLINTFSSCSSTKHTTEIIPPELLYQHPLPAFPKPISHSQLRIPLEIFVLENGTVKEVRFENSSGSKEWDSLATASIIQWKYSPARSDDKPIRIWLRQTAIVRFSEPNFLLLEEIICKSSHEADSAYALLMNGVKFIEVVKQFSVAPSRNNNGALGSVNIQIFPEQIKTTLSKLSKEGFTKPIKFGNQYAIFKRLKE